MKHILLVDDNKMNLNMARIVLCNDYKITAVMKGSQALTFLENNTCDIVLLDINMPEMDGFEVLEKIRKIEHCKNIPVIFLTADNNAATETKCFEVGAVDFIAKPFVPEVVRSRISRSLELEELRKNLAERLEQKTQEVTEIKSKSYQDALTGLWNRAYTEENVEKLIAEGNHGALMMIDMDNFKAINDLYGHIAGDHTLKMFADTLRTYAKEGDILCRVGGDEFIVFVKEVISKSELEERAANIIRDLNKKLDECKFDTNSSVSIGIAQTPEDGSEYKTLYNCADKALYYVKQNGKNMYHFFSEQSEDEKNRAGKLVDLNYVKEIMVRGDNGKGAYLLDYDNFQHVYKFIRRFAERSEKEAQIILFTAVSKEAKEPDVVDVEQALEALERAIYSSLRRADVSTRYSSRQIIVVLMNSNTEDGDTVVKRILHNFDMMYDEKKVAIEYGLMKVDSPKQ
ncbi:MAG: diguanylate cyclase [Lachnospiraceae bacterium]|nr:diguanylate cyclase [Lachnospiraceae bacterium]